MITGGDLQLSFDIVDDEGGWRLFSWREWGYIMAEWANAHWLKRPGGLGDTDWTRANRPWEYLDFYSFCHLDYLVDGYGAWLEALQDVVSRKVEMFG